MTRRPTLFCVPSWALPLLLVGSASPREWRALRAASKAFKVRR